MGRNESRFVDSKRVRRLEYTAETFGLAEDQVDGGITTHPTDIEQLTMKTASTPQIASTARFLLSRRCVCTRRGVDFIFMFTVS